MSGTNGTVRAAMRRLALLAGLTLMVACTPITRNHGYVPSDEALAGIRVGVDTRDSVTTALGSPTTDGVDANSSFYYIASHFATIGPFPPRETSREVVAIDFGNNGKVSNIARYSLADGKVITLSQRVTEDNVRDTTFLRQLLGNIGRFNAGDLIGTSAPPGG
ncbi:MAG: outer membrane protein assembly factor BamE [Limimaricola sp.]|uniref:outer membrane protein assembly factor BamE n=1 Tax=Limimaricola sp. TaxID=2211665 RepID=UPI001D55370E|nr:outer membrane protein assembly factor BamE [Limimaricola sp.]MBI1418306.1 outer membrane protein assembly factor BamE [Limimaricola sp.]